jgi:hypothetical protein
VPPLSHLTSCTPTKSNFYLANSLAAAVSEPPLYRLLTLQVPNLMSLSPYFGRTKVSLSPGPRLWLWMFGDNIRLYGEELLAPRSTPKLEDHTLSAACDCLFNIFAATLHTAGRSSIRNLRTRHSVVTGTQLSHEVTIHRYLIWNKVLP